MEFESARKEMGEQGRPSEVQPEQVMEDEESMESAEKCTKATVAMLLGAGTHAAGQLIGITRNSIGQGSYDTLLDALVADPSLWSAQKIYNIELICRRLEISESEKIAARELPWEGFEDPFRWVCNKHILYLRMSLTQVSIYNTT